MRQFLHELMRGRSDMSRWTRIKFELRHHLFGVVKSQRFRRMYDRFMRTPK